jgi:hypothetical protein
MTSEVHSFRDFASGNREEDCASPVVACLLVALQGHDGLEVVFGLNEDEFVLSHLLQYAHVVPLDDDVLHVLVGGEEADHSIGHHLAQLHQQGPVAPDVPRVLPLIELRADGQLVITLCHNQRRYGIPGQLDVDGQ